GPDELLDRDGAEVAQPEDLARQLALAAGEDEPAPLQLGVEWLPVEPLANADGRHGARREARVCEELEAQRAETRTRCRGARFMTGEDAGGRFGRHQPQPLVDLEDDRDRRRPGRLALGVRVAVGPKIEIEA